MTNLGRLEAAYAAATPGRWQAAENPIDDKGYMTTVELPGKAGQPGTWLALLEHNWNEAAVGERRISWKEAENNAAFIVLAHNEMPGLIAEVRRLRELLDCALSEHEDHYGRPIGGKLSPHWSSQARAALGDSDDR